MVLRELLLLGFGAAAVTAKCARCPLRRASMDVSETEKRCPNGNRPPLGRGPGLATSRAALRGHSAILSRQVEIYERSNNGLHVGL